MCVWLSLYQQSCSASVWSWRKHQWVWSWHHVNIIDGWCQIILGSFIKTSLCLSVSQVSDVFIQTVCCWTFTEWTLTVIGWSNPDTHLSHISYISTRLTSCSAALTQSLSSLKTEFWNVCHSDDCKTTHHSDRSHMWHHSSDITSLHSLQKDEHEQQNHFLMETSYKQ